MKIAIIGSGNVATHLAIGFDKAGHTISQIISRKTESAKKLAVRFGAYYGSALNSLEINSDLVLICVSDAEINNVIKELPHVNGVLAHTCGTFQTSHLSAKSKKFGCFYPLQTFSKGSEINLLEVPFLINACNRSVYQNLDSLARDISNLVLEVPDEERLKYHLAAVFANNFTNYLFSVSKEVVDSNDLDWRVLKPIIEETGKKIGRFDPDEAQTGPAIRGDFKTIDKHRQILETNHDLLELYNLITKRIQEKAKK